jgi:hypothetical protein
MGILRRLFGGEPKANGDGTTAYIEPPPTDSISQLLMEHGLPAMDKQLHLEDLVGEGDWLLDQDAGTITFGGEKACPAQVLGTQSDASRTWQWAWANRSISEGLTKDALLMRTYGEQHGVEEFMRPQLPLSDTISAEALAMITSQLANADAYYRGPYEGGAVFVMVRLPDDAPRPVDGDLLRAFRTLSASLMGLPVPIRRQAVRNYLNWVGLKTEDQGRDLIGRDSSGESVTVSFDGLGRIGQLSSTLGG